VNPNRLALVERAAKARQLGNIAEKVKVQKLIKKSAKKDKAPYT
jgi:hypothetical protein